MVNLTKYLMLQKWKEREEEEDEEEEEREQWKFYAW